MTRANKLVTMFLYSIGMGYALYELPLAHALPLVLFLAILCVVVLNIDNFLKLQKQNKNKEK